MPTSLSLQSSGPISLGDIRDLFKDVFAVSNISLRSLAHHANLTTSDSFSEFYGYTLSCSTPTTALTFSSIGGPVQDVNISISGGSEIFSASANQTWINLIENQSNDIVTITCDENTGLERTGTVTISHDDNTDVLDTISITQNPPSPIKIGI